MFICLGENDRNEKSFGIGDTIEDAVRNWASGGDYLSQFKVFTPTIFQNGNKMAVKLRVEFEITN